MFFKLISFWPPFLGAGIRIKSISSDLMSVEVELKRRFWNNNAVGVQFGGSIYAMTDPFYMLMLLEKLGKKYIIWDKAAHIRFRKPGRTKLIAKFELTPAILTQIEEEIQKGNGRYDWTKLVEVKDPDGNLIAEVEKVIYFKKKEATAPATWV